ncbi:hypothetical protein [Phycicoccus sp.]|uniref:hypothetical protein n=1 Tax=Phycicoccus sp. TaxID=1902410 RepID=UPI002C9635CE|nr:hypothetical protein [Phycicoccus sp.]HMM95411.1 hypothetical protein [Phycicoccus sp.]
MLLTFAWLDVGWMIYLGLGIVTGGAQRMSGPGYRGITLVPDELGLSPHLFWGIPLIVGGSAFLLGLFAHNKVGFWLRIAGIVVGALAAGSLYAFFTVTSAANPRVGNTAPPTYLFVAGFQLAMLYGAVFTRRIEPTIRTTKG